MTICRGPLLPIEDAGDHTIGVMGREPVQQRDRGEAPRPDRQEVEAVTATAESESPVFTEYLMGAICDPDNIEAALRAVVRNKGAPGVDGITVQQLPVLKARWPEIEDQLLQGRYQPQPVRRVKIPKPAGGTPNLGIPTVIDRVTRQAVLQRLQPQWDPTFSKHSYGFGRAAPLTRRWRRRKPTSSKATGLSWISTWPNSWKLLHNAPGS